MSTTLIVKNTENTGGSKRKIEKSVNESDSSTKKVKRDWWRHEIIYQIYPRSFKDTTANGTGDLKGEPGTRSLQ